ncbi:MAG TPA: hypothetical protein VH419_11700 [Nocardioidaceae bacterium]
MRRVVVAAGLAIVGSAPFALVSNAAAADSVKPAVVGLVDRQRTIDDNWAGVIRGVVVQVDWAALQPTRDGPIVTNNPIDAAVTAVQAYNQRHPDATLGIKLRVMAGRGSPQWLKDRAGYQFVQSPVDQSSGTVPFWWKRQVDTAYRALQQALAARYDGIPEIREVQITRCTVLYDEPFMRITGDRVALTAFVANGLTRAADQTCYKQEVQAHAVWHQTRSVLALNPYQDPATVPITDVDFTVSMAKQCRRLLTNRCVIENHSIRETSLGADYDKLYKKMTVLGRPMAMQTNRPDVLGDLGVVLRRCVGMGAEAVELPWTYRQMTPEAFRAAYGDVISALDPAVVAVP